MSSKLYSANGDHVGNYLHGSESNSNLFVCYRQEGKVALFGNSGMADSCGDGISDLVRIIRFTGRVARPISKTGLFRDNSDFFDFLNGMAGEHDAAVVEAEGFEHQPSDVFRAHGEVYLRAVQLNVMRDFRIYGCCEFDPLPYPDPEEQ